VPLFKAVHPIAAWTVRRALLPGHPTPSSLGDGNEEGDSGLGDESGGDQRGMPRALSESMNSNEVEISGVEAKIYLIRGQKVMLDEDLARLYEVPTKRINEQVTRNLDRFPADFMFSLTNQEFENLKSQFATSSLAWGGRRKLPRAFTEQGIAMLSSVLQNGRAIHVNIAIMRAFVQMRQILISNKDLEIKLKDLEAKYERHDHELKAVFEAIRRLMAIRAVPPKRITGLGRKDE
jgi:hypothetical protein